MRLIYFCTLLLALAVSPIAQALAIRADREDSEYLELATKYASAVRLPSGAGGVLIKDRWILTTAQAAKAIADSPSRVSVAFGEKAHLVEEAIPHPDWRRPGGPNDIGLLVLKEAVKGVAPTPIYPAKSENGRPVVLVGFGPTGKIGAPPATASDGKKRASINTVDGVGPMGLEVRVKSGDDASDLQGALVPGDFGGPLYFDSPDGLFVVGIAYAIEGDIERFARVSAYFGWINDTMLEVATREAALLLQAQ
jgi:hypothetical protein